ncbi:zinc finger protein [Trichonephila inaurata madagascariensis]|uniref:Zinc finger protein n=1 Tax=Trichonephila inaurata madagascariensis TaxID=2747483 RepID=A0A8X7BPP4_9ARAC|nr:zinc finger protein [Trichonephila inaurata madagascariensis]
MDVDNNSPSKAKSFACEICQRSFSRLHRLQSHLRSHRNKKVVKQNKSSVKEEEPDSPPVAEEKEEVNENFDDSTDSRSAKKEDPQCDQSSRVTCMHLHLFSVKGINI